jgi:hypothetical protein
MKHSPYMTDNPSQIYEIYFKGTINALGFMNVIWLLTGYHRPVCQKLTFINPSAFVGL